MDLVLSQLATVAVFVERGTQWIKSIFNYSEKFPAQQKYIDIAIVAGGNLALCYFWHVNLFAAVGFNFEPVAGELLTGAIASFGSEIVHEFAELLKMLRSKVEAK